MSLNNVKNYILFYNYLTMLMWQFQQAFGLVFIKKKKKSKVYWDWHAVTY
jgi:hypothetical protein